MKRLLLLLFLFSLAVRVPHIAGPLRWEERDIVTGLRDISIQPGQLYIPPKVGDHTSLSVLFSWFFFRCAPFSPWALRIPSVVLGALLPVLLALGLWRITNRHVAIMAGLLVATHNFLICWSAYFMQEMTYLFFGLLGFLFLEKARRKESFGHALVSAFFLALAFWSHEFALLLFPMAGFYLLVDGPSSRAWLRTPAPWGATGMWLLMVAPYFVWNMMMREKFAHFGGMSLAQQHLLATMVSQRGFNFRFLEFFVTGGLADMSTRWPRVELNHSDPIMGVVLLSAAGLCLLPPFRKKREVRLALIPFWCTMALFLIIDLRFRIYRFSITLLPACVMAGVVLSAMWNSRRRVLRLSALFVVAYALFSGIVTTPHAQKAAHNGFRWWRKGPLFSESSLIDALREAQHGRKASLVVLPGLFWDHVPLRAEYETGVRYVGGSRETIYSSTYWLRPYSPTEASHVRLVISCQEDVASWRHWLEARGYRGPMEKHDIAFKGILQDTTFVCPVYFLEMDNPNPPPVEVFLERIYASS